MAGDRTGHRCDDDRASTALTKAEAKNAGAGAKDSKLTGAGGLHLFVTTSGHASWRLRYELGGNEKRLLLGAFPDVTLARARAARRRQAPAAGEPHARPIGRRGSLRG